MAENLCPWGRLIKREALRCKIERLPWGLPMSNSQELLDTALRHCNAIQAVIDDLAAKGAHTELRLLAHRLQRLAFRSTPNTPGE